MSESTARLELRLAAISGLLSAAVLLVNAAKRAELLPSTAATQLVAPLAQIFAIGLVLGLYVAVRGRRPRLLTAGLIANLIALTALVGVEFVINLVFAYLGSAQIDELLTGPLGAALIGVSILFVAATLTYVAGLWRSGGTPRAPLALYAVAAVPIGLRAFVPEIALQLALGLLAVALTWLALALWRRTAELAA